MSLTEEREQWRKEFEEGKVEIPVLALYREMRGSNSWRGTRAFEQLCEYIFWLEEKEASK